jgi:hypothetical protein
MVSFGDVMIDQPGPETTPSGALGPLRWVLTTGKSLRGLGFSASFGDAAVKPKIPRKRPLRKRTEAKTDCGLKIPR